MGDGRFLINLLLGSDSGETEIPFDVLAKVDSYKEEVDTTFVATEHKPYAPRSIKRLTLHFENGTSRAAYAHSVGYFEGYQYDLFESKKAAYKDAYEQLKLRAQLENESGSSLECWGCGALYTEPGHVRSGMMECDECE